MEERETVIDIWKGKLRFADRILSASTMRPPAFVRPEWIDTAKNLAWLQEGLRRAVVFRIDNVAEYFFAGTPKEEWDICEDFPCLAPPYPVFWMEYKMPKTIISETFGNEVPGSMR